MAFEDLAFTRTWRDYQAAVLAKADSYATDGRVHVVAPPGAGKTVLGLELMRRAGRPAIVLAPTIVVRDQWAARLAELFTPDGVLPAYVSTDLARPAAVTIATYQGLYAVMGGSGEPVGVADPDDAGEADGLPVDVDDARREQFLGDLMALGTATIVVDECHHLKRGWWSALDALAARLGNAGVIALTGTPPFDAPPAEWARYEGFCGPVDVEVAVPTLVAAGDLCPHQDLVWLGLPTSGSEAELAAQNERTKAFLVRLRRDSAFVDAVAAHPALDDPAVWAQAILARPGFFASLVVFLTAVGRESRAKPLLLALAGRLNATAPPLDTGYFQTLLQGVLFDDPFFTGTKARAAVVQRVQDEGRRAGVLSRRHVDLYRSDDVATILHRDQTALDAVEQIVAFERDSRGAQLRLVVLCDAIHAEFLPPNHRADAMPLGVVPAFERLRSGADVGVLSGSLVVIPAAARPAFEAAWDGPAEMPRMVPYPTDEHYVMTKADDASRHGLVTAVTRLFEEGDIRVLVGTAALLGEGWDAPALNSLVLATHIAAYVTSNQLRGRAIRIDPGQPDKVATIWHLATLAIRTDAAFGLSAGPVSKGEPRQPGPRSAGPEGDGTPRITDLGPDLAQVRRRFGWLVGVDRAADVIRSGIARTLTFPLDAPMPVDAVRAAALASNEQALADARDLGAIRRRWEAVLRQTPHGELVQTTLVSQDLDGPRSAFAMDLIVALATCGGAAVLALTGWEGSLTLVLAIIAPFLWLAFLGRSLWASRSAFARRRAVAQSLLETMVAQRIIGRGGNPQLVARRQPDGTAIGIVGGSQLDSGNFLGALDGLFGPVGQTKFVVRVRPHVGGRMYEAYYCLPSVLSSRADADLFAARWGARAGRVEAILVDSKLGEETLPQALIVGPPTFTPPASPVRQTTWL